MEGISQLTGKTLASVIVSDDRDSILFETVEGLKFKSHGDCCGLCCERVFVEDISGDLKDLIGSPITKAEESSNSETPPGATLPTEDSFTWTFYLLATAMGYVAIRWLGESNGFYSEGVDFYEVKP